MGRWHTLSDGDPAPLSLANGEETVDDLWGGLHRGLMAFEKYPYLFDKRRTERSRTRVHSFKGAQVVFLDRFREKRVIYQKRTPVHLMVLYLGAVQERRAQAAQLGRP